MGERLPPNINPTSQMSLPSDVERLEVPKMEVGSLTHKQETVLYDRQWQQEKEIRRFHNLSLRHGRIDGERYINGIKTSW